MKRPLQIVAIAALLGIAGTSVQGQEKPKEESQHENAARLFATVKVHFVLNEFDGDKKIACGLNSDDAGQYLMRFNFDRTALAPPPTNDYDNKKGDPAFNYAAIRLPTFRST